VIIKIIKVIRQLSGGWAGHVAACVYPHANLRSIQGTLQVPLNECYGLDSTTKLITMASADHDDIPPPLLHCIFPP